MKVSEGKIGRTFVIRLEDGETVPDCIEEFAGENNISSAVCWLLGGIKSGRLVVGPEDPSSLPPVPMIRPIDDVHEIAAVGTIFSNEEGRPVLHLHGALGRDSHTYTGCSRPGLDIWKIGEVVIMEIHGTDMIRKKDGETGLELLTTR